MNEGICNEKKLYKITLFRLVEYAKVDLPQDNFAEIEKKNLNPQWRFLG